MLHEQKNSDASVYLRSFSASEFAASEKNAIIELLMSGCYK